MGDTAAKVDSDKKGFRPGEALFRTALPTGCPVGGSEAECRRVLSSGGVCISRPYTLGKNIAGTEDLVVPGMAPGEEVIAVRKGRHGSLAAAAAAAAKDLCMRYGQSDVAEYAAWKTADGGIRESMCASRWVEPGSAGGPRLFCDNLNVSTTKGRDDVGKGTVYQFLKPFGLKPHGRGTVDAGVPMDDFFSVSYCASAKASSQQEWKIMLADVAMNVVWLLLAILDFAKDHRGSDVSDFGTEMRGIMAAHPAVILARGLTFLMLLNAAAKAQELYLVNYDLAFDLSGCQNSDVVKEVGPAMFPGLEVSEAAPGKLTSGLNCVYFCTIDEDDAAARMKIYNKGVETIQQGGSVRSKDVSDKSGYLLNPSTRRLTDVFHDPRYFMHGVTRIEFTIECSSSIGAVKRLVKKYTAILSAPGALVSCSMHEMIKSMGMFVRRSVVVFYPHISEAKAAMWANRSDIEVSESEDPEKRHSDFRKQLIDTPEAFLMRYHNSRTGKVNGLTIRGHCATRSGRSKSAWAMTAEALGWASTCKNDSFLFICVAGDTGGEEGGVSGLADMSNMYFRMLVVKRTGDPSVTRTCLPWHCNFKNDNHKNRVTDWATIGVRVDEQENLRYALCGRDTVPTFDSMGRIDIEVSGVSEEADEWSVAGSEERAAVTGIECQTYKLEDHSGALGVRVAWSDYKICLVGKSNTEKLRFKVCGDWFWVPVGALGRQLIEYLKGLDSGGHKTICEVWMDEGDGFHWRPRGGGGVGGSKVIGKCNAAKALPVKETPYVILGAGLEWTGRKSSLYLRVEEGQFYAPQSIREKVLTRVNEKGGDEGVNEFLTGKLIKHTASCFKKPRGVANREELFAIVDDSGVVVASNIYDGQKRQCR